MAIKQETNQDNTIYFNDRFSRRYIDAIGNGITKYIEGPGVPTDDTTGDPTSYTLTVTEVGTGTSTVVNSTTEGQIFLVTTAANEYDGVNLQLKGEQFKLKSTNELYFGCKLQVSDATQSDLFIGLAETDTTLLATGTAHAIALGGDGVFISKLDGSTTLAGKVYLDGAETATANYGTALANNTDIYVDIYWNGETVQIYIDNTLVTSSAASLPDGDLTISFNYRAGEAVAKTAIIKELKCIQW